MLVIVGLFLFFLFLTVTPFLPKEEKSPVIHNNIHIINNPVNTAYSAPASQEPEKAEASEYFGRDRLRL